VPLPVHQVAHKAIPDGLLALGADGGWRVEAGRVPLLGDWTDWASAAARRVRGPRSSPRHGGGLVLAAPHLGGGRAGQVHGDGGMLAAGSLEALP
jgi:hypothetical protein